MLHHRRQFLKAGLSLAAAGCALRLSAQELKRPLTLCNLHTDEVLTVRHRGPGAEEAMPRIASLLRDPRTGEGHPIDAGLLDILSDVADSLGADPVFQVLSAYRSPSAGPMVRSLHTQGRAIDVRLAGTGSAELASRARALARGGVGYFGRADFVHLDTGAPRSWRG